MNSIAKKIFGLVLILSATSAFAQTYYVDALKGNNSNTGTSAAQAWATIQKAADNVVGGSTVIISGGTYYEKVTIASRCSGVAGAPTIFKNKDGETVVIEGQVFNPNSFVVRWVGQLSVTGAKYVTIKGVKVQNVNWYGIRVENNSSNIMIDSCATLNSGASGIYVNTCADITVTRNKVLKACQVTVRETGTNNGTQECITLTRTSAFKVNKNEVGESTVNGSAGGEGIDIKGSSYNGEVADNYIHDILVLGIYIDAGTGEEYNIRVYNNKLYRTFGLGVAGELGGYARDIYFYNNIVANSEKSGLVFQSTGNGKFTNVYVVNNTFYNCAKSGFAGDIGSYSTNTGNANNRIHNNIFYNKEPNSRFSIWYNYPAGHVVSNNLYFDFKPSVNGALSFNANNLTAADVRLDPQFKDANNNNFSLLSTSPAIGKGIPITLPNSNTPLFTTDLNGNPKGTNWSMGAYEYSVNTPINTVNEADNVTIYPNPGNDYIILDKINRQVQIEIYDILGKQVIAQKVSDNLVKIDISGLNKGVYVVKIMDKNKALRVGKFVKQ
jgi:parallel beta-helix repeat protein